MATPRKKTSPQIANLIAKAMPIGVKKVDEHWSTCELEDGTKIKMRPIIVDVRRDKRKFDKDGEPIYYVKTALISHATSPRRLHKKTRKKKKTK